MFDFHMHSIVSFDGHDTGLQLAQAAAKAGLKEICFTDHMDYVRNPNEPDLIFDIADYNAAYDGLEIPGLTIRRGVEYGLYEDNTAQMAKDLQLRNYDFVLGSIHFVDDIDVYFPEYWEGKTIFEAQQRYFETMLECVKVHDNFDVLSHMTYLHKSKCCPVKEPMRFEDHRELIDEILRVLAAKGKGMEMNTSGIDRCGGFLPTVDFFKRFKELGGEIVTVGSDAHTSDRVGQYCDDACRVLGEVFGYVCTFENRKPVFHKIGG